MDNKICLITGATSGIGRVTAAELAKQGAHVIVHGRNRQKAEATRLEIIQLSGHKRVDILVGDLFSLTDTRRLAQELIAGYPRLDVLINNAGAILGANREITSDGIEKTIAVNHLAPFLLTSLLWPLLKRSKAARIINVSSVAHKFARINWDDLLVEKNYRPLRAYANAKLYTILFTRELNEKLKQAGIKHITVNASHPGDIYTGFGKESSWLLRVGFRKLLKPFLLTAAQGADNSVYLASSADIEHVSGQYFVKRKAVSPGKKYITKENAERLWLISEQLTNERFVVQ